MNKDLRGKATASTPPMGQRQTRKQSKELWVSLTALSQVQEGKAIYKVMTEPSKSRLHGLGWM